MWLFLTNQSSLFHSRIFTLYLSSFMGLAESCVRLKSHTNDDNLFSKSCYFTCTLMTWGRAVLPAKSLIIGPYPTCRQYWVSYNALEVDEKPLFCLCQVCPIPSNHQNRFHKKRDPEASTPQANNYHLSYYLSQHESFDFLLGQDTGKEYVEKADLGIEIRSLDLNHVYLLLL